MSGIARVKERMKQKVTLINPQQLGEAQEKTGRKIYALSKEDNLRLKKIFSKRLNLQNGTSISNLMSEAITLLYFQEFPH